MRRFKWIDWNRQKVANHAPSTDEIEAAIDRMFSLTERRDGSFQMYAATLSGRRIWVIWRYDREDDEIPDVFGGLGEPAVFVITAYYFVGTPMIPAPDSRSPDRRARDEQIAAEPPLPPPDLSADAAPMPMAAHLKRRPRPFVVAGVVENGLVRPLDPGVKLPERSRVIVAAADGA